MSSKGKEKVTGGDKGKRKWSGGDNDKTGQKRKNRGVLQFFEDRAYEVGDDDDEDSSDDSMWDYDFDEEEFVAEGEANKAPGKAPQYPCIPKEEEMSEEELEKMLEERYKAGSNFVTYAEDGYENKRSFERDMYVPSAKDPTIWKVKCMVGRERQSAFCLMQKYVDLNFLGAKLRVISAFAVDHVKGFIFIEADKQHDIYEACKGLCTIYPSRVIPVPPKEIHYLFSSRSKSNAISEGMWARVKNGKYKGDLAQVVAVNDLRKKVTVKLIPRIDLRAMAEKFGGGVSAKRMATPAPRLISASELEEFRPLIQQRRDRDTNQMFDVLDGMLLKDGYLYKKVSVDSLSLWGVMPTDDELLKFEPSKSDESNNDGQWLAQLFGEENKHIHATKKDKGGGKGGKGGKEGGSCSSTVENNFEMHDLVFFGRKDFGVVVGTAKDDSIKVIKEGSEGPSVVSVKQRDLKSASFDKKLFTVLDQHAQTISINDIVRVLDGPLKDRQGTVKKIYRGILFICDGSEQENYGYICAKAQLCEKVNISGKVTKEKNQGSEPGGPSGFEDLPSSPQCPLSPNNSWQEKDTRTNFNRQDNGIFSVGQLLRIKLGPLKGYLCRVLAVRRSEVTVKLDSQHKILTVKCDHLSEVRGRNAAISQGEDSESVKPFGFLAPQDGSSDWMDGTALSTDGEKWNAGGSSTERSSWSAFPSSSSLHQDSGPAGPSNLADNDAEKGTEGSAWEIKATPSQNSSWGAAAADEKMVANNGSGGSWGSSRDDAGGSTEAWNKIGASLENETSGWGNAGGKFDQPEVGAWRKDAGASTWKDTAGSNDGQNENWGNNKKDDDAAGWGKVGSSSNKGTGGNGEPSWGNASSAGQTDSWSKPNPPGADGGTSWGNQDGKSWNKQGTSSSKHDGGSSWGKQEEGSNGSKQNDRQSWDKKGGESSWGSGGVGAWGKQDGASGNKKDGESSWSKQDGESWGKQVGGSNGSKQNDGNSWGKKDGESSWGSGGGGAWGKQDGASGNKKDGESSWSKQTGGSTWGKKPDGNAEDQSDSWGNSKGGFGGWKNGGAENSDADQDGSWGRGKSFDGGRGSGGRRGRGRGGGRGQYGSGRFDQQSQDSSGDFLEGHRSSWSDGQAGSWKKDTATEGNRSSWSGGQAGSWNNDTSSEGNKGDGWGKKIVSGEYKESGWKKEWHANKETAETGDKSVESDLNNKSSGWGSSNDGQSSGWNRSTVNEDAGNDQRTWAKGKSSDDKNTSSWNTGNASNENQASEWGKNDISGSKKPSDDKSSGWKNTSGPSTGWGKSNWSGGGTDDTGGNQGNTWSSKTNWSSGNGFGGNDDQNDSGSGRGRSGSWRGGREGRGDRGGFRGRGRSDRGGFGGRGRGGFGGRDGGDREGGFRGRGGGFRGRGRGDWNNRNDSGDDGTSDWRNGSNGNSEGWKSSSGGGTWSSGGGGWKSSTEAKIDNGGSSAAGDDWKNSNASTVGSWGSGWNNSKGDADGAGNNQAGGGWKSSTEAKTDHGQSSAGGGNWKTSNSPTEDVSTAWGQGSGKGDTAGSTQPSWGKAGGSSWGSASRGEGPANSWGKAAGSSWGTAGGGENSSAKQENKSEAAGGWKTNESNPHGGSSGSWGQ